MNGVSGRLWQQAEVDYLKMAALDGHDIRVIAKHFGWNRRRVILKAKELGLKLEPSNDDHEVLVYLADDIFAKLQQAAKDLGTSTPRTARMLLMSVLRDPWLFDFAVQPSMYVEDEPRPVRVAVTPLRMENVNGHQVE